MSVSVLTLNKNRTPHLLQLIEGLKRNTDMPDELIIVEMSDIPPVLPKTAFPIRLVNLQTDTLPLANARNLAMQNARFENLIFLDVDCIPSSDLVRSIQQNLEENMGIYSPKILYLPPLDLGKGWRESQLQKKGKAHSVRDFCHAGLRREENPGLFWSLAFGLTQKTFNEIGGFCEDYVGYGAEDTDFGFRVQAKNIPHYFTTNCQAYHQYHTTFEPPYQHFSAIIANAKIFFQHWKTWPMDGWLKAFERDGLIQWTNKDIIIKSYPEFSI